MSLRQLYLSVCLLVCALSVSAQPAAGVGFRFMQVPASSDSAAAPAMKAVLFYPAAVPTGTATLGPLEIDAQSEVPPAEGRWPLVVISHGTGASMFSHHDSAAALARAGFMVAAIEHPGDNFRDRRAQGSDLTYAGRTLHVRQLLDHLTTQPALAARIDMERVGVFGFSAGGYTALMLAGAEADFSRLPDFCQSQPEAVFCAAGGQMRRSSPPLQPQPDTRIDAAFVIAPLGQPLFSEQALAAVKTPVYLYSAAADSSLPADNHARYVRNHLGNLAGETELIAGDHFVFLAPCSDKLAEQAPVLCQDDEGVDRRAIHQQMNRQAVAFFKRWL